MLRTHRKLNHLFSSIFRLNKNIHMGKLFNGFWKVWHKQYITDLTIHIKGFKPKCTLHKDSIVLVKEDNIPRL